MSLQTVNTPSRRKSIINVFSTPPLRRSLFSGNRKLFTHVPSHVHNHSAPGVASATDSDDEDDENTLTATGDISLSYPYYVPGVAGALSPKPKSRRGTPNLRAIREPQRPRPPVRRVASDTYKFRTLTLRGGPTANVATPSREMSGNATKPSPQATPFEVPQQPIEIHVDARARNPGDESFSSFCGSIGSIEDEDPMLSTPQSRFEAFMKGRDLTRSPKKKEDNSIAERMDALAQAATSALARPNTRPLRGNARLPARMPIPNWAAMDVDECN
ncbi:hypothetical protein B0H19DRAFT_1246039 [Mycena capillaripes]|nr:hypothetical protein B0H19DRAFT_1246039 [Mycena capillaripes]